MFCCFLLFHVVKRDQNIGDEPTLLLERCSHPHAAQHETVFVFIQDVCPPEESSSVRLHLICRRNIVEWLMTHTCSLTHQLTSTHRPTGLSEPMDTDSNNERPEANRSNAVSYRDTWTCFLFISLSNKYLMNELMSKVFF